MNPGPMTAPSVFYVRSPLALRRFFCPHLCRGRPMASIPAVKVPQSPRRSATEASLHMTLSIPPKTGGSERSGCSLVDPDQKSGSESELSAIGFSTCCFAEDVSEWTPRSRHASLRRTGHRRNRSAPMQLSTAIHARLPGSPHGSAEADVPTPALRRGWKRGRATQGNHE